MSVGDGIMLWNAEHAFPTAERHSLSGFFPDRDAILLAIFSLHEATLFDFDRPTLPEVATVHGSTRYSSPVELVWCWVSMILVG